MEVSARFHMFLRSVIGLFSTRINQCSAMKQSRYYCASDAIVEGKKSLLDLEDDEKNGRGRRQ